MALVDEHAQMPLGMDLHGARGHVLNAFSWVRPGLLAQRLNARNGRTDSGLYASLSLLPLSLSLRSAFHAVQPEDQHRCYRE